MGILQWAGHIPATSLCTSWWGGEKGGEGERSRRGRERGRKEGGWGRGGGASKIKEGAVRSGAS